MSSRRQWFDLACDLPDGERVPALRAAGLDDAAIAEVLELLATEDRTHARARGPLDRLAEELIATELRAGDMVGAWKLVREIGRGGMGAVFLAERGDGHFHQQAAVKLLHGRRGPEAAARLARERQLLADLQHPQIARLIDGGATPQGHPYLVMEYVDGVRIDRWCHDAGAGFDARLRLFRSICAVVQFAHRRLIAHCDLKPANVLVREDGVPILLDFGIARAVDADPDPPPRDRVAAAMTPRYASPEQLRGEFAGLASDVHALGLMLFELMAGVAPPLQRERGVPPRPSDAAPQALRWKRRLRGDIDAIVARACAPDPASRYDSAAALAEDVARIAQQRPVLARAAHPAYVLGRLLRRRWAAFAIGAAVLVLALGFGWRTFQAERRARVEAAAAQRATEFLVSVFAASDSNLNTGTRRELTAREVLDAGRARIDSELANQPAVRARLLEALGNAYRHMNRGAQAAPLLRQAAELNLSPLVDDEAAAARALESLTNAMANGEFRADDTVDVARRALELARRVATDDSQQVANAWMVLSLALNRSGRYEDALDAARRTLRINLAREGADTRRPAAHSNLGMILTQRGRHAEARRELDTSIALSEPGTMGEALRLRWRAVVLHRLGAWRDAEADWMRALRIAAQVHGDHDSFAVAYRQGLARLEFARGRYDAGFALVERARTDQLALGGEASPEMLTIAQTEGEGRLLAGQLDAAITLFDRVRDERQEEFGHDDPRTIEADLLGARARLEAGHDDEALGARLNAIVAWWTARTDSAPLPLSDARLALAQWHLARAEPDAADSWLTQVIAAGEDALDPIQRARLMGLRASIARSREHGRETIAWGERSLAYRVATFGTRDPHLALAARALARDVRAHDPARATELESRWSPNLAGFPVNSAFRESAASH